MLLADHDYLPLTVPGNSLLCPVCYFDILWVFTHPAYMHISMTTLIKESDLTYTSAGVQKLETCVY